MIRIATLIVFVLIGSISFGQSLNIKGGSSFSIIKIGNIPEGTTTETFYDQTYVTTHNYYGNTGYHFAASYEFRLGNRLSLEAGMRYQSRGFNLVSINTTENEVDTTRRDDDVTYRFKYVDVPVVLNVAITTGDLRTYGRAGVYLGYLASGKYSIHTELFSSYSGDSVEDYETKLVGNDIPTEDRYTAGFILGVGAEYKNFYFETNYNRGIFSLADLNSKTVTQDLSFSLGYKFKFGE